ncbi:hypothetical protein SH528x_005773 [Novipirellula sp. SH528]|uniref:hypothetical protein n=1 Tax=Novipirellula sp. SH528 TaxID=3454466 RepID=UPI003F9F9230
MKIFAILTLLVLWGSFQHCSLAVGKDPSSELESVSLANPFFAKLSATSRAIVDGKPFRSAVTELADRVEIPIVLDRHIDPSASVNVGQIGPTVFAGIQQVAESRDCVTMPIAGVLLVGRPEWVDATSEAILSLPAAPGSSASAKIDVQWPAATTPSEAIRLIAIASGKDTSTTELPHDLWPAANWKSIGTDVATTLVTAQFLQPPTPQRSRSQTSISPATATSKRFAIPYRLDANRTPVIAAIRGVDRQSKLKNSGKEIEITATAAAHRAGIEAFLASQEAKQAANVSLDKKNLTLTLQNTSASEVLNKLAAAAGRACRIEQAANEPCSQLITMSMQNASLRQLVDEVAKQAGVDIEWTNDTLVVSARVNQ